jgi:hypothetical protein
MGKASIDPVEYLLALFGGHPPGAVRLPAVGAVKIAVPGREENRIETDMTGTGSILIQQCSELSFLIVDKHAHVPQPS